MRFLCLRAIALATAAIGLAVVGIGAQAAQGQWRYPAGDSGSTRYSGLDQITRDNVRQLTVAWRRPAVDPSLTAATPTLNAPRDFRATPLMIDGVLYSSNGIGLVEAFHPGTGQNVVDPAAVSGRVTVRLRGNSTRRWRYWADGATRRLFVIRGEYLVALDPATGRP